MALNFPDNPQTGDTYLAPNNQTYLYDGEKWIGFITPAGTIAQGITFVGDDSSGTRVSDGESFKIAGTQNITTAVSGDTLTITGINTGDFAFSGNTLSTTSSNADMELDPAGTGNLILKSGNFLPAADNTQYLGSANKRWHTLYVGPGSININGVTISESAGKLNIPGGVTGTQGLASIILPVPSYLPYSGQNDNQGNPFLFGNNTVFLDQHTYLYIRGKVLSGGIWTGWTVGTEYPEALGFTPATFTHTHSNGALTQLTLASGGSGLSVAATDNIMAFRNGDPITTTLASPYAGILGTVDAQGSSQDTLTTINQLTAGGTFTAQDQSLFFDNINLQTGANIVFSDSTTQNTAARITVVGDDSTGTTLNAGETIKIAGSGSVTTSVSGDTITITGSGAASVQGITIVGDDSTGTRVSDGESFKIAGTSNITTAVLGDTLTITGPNLSSYLTAVPKTIDVNAISSSDSSAIQINDAVNISGAVTANAGLTINNNSNTWTFGSDGLLTVPANGIITAPNAQEFRLQSKDTNSLLRNEIELDPNNGTYMSVRSEELSTSFSTGSWATASWVNASGFGAAYFTGAEDLQNFWTTGPGSFVDSVEVSINGGARGRAGYEGNNGGGSGVELSVDRIPVSSPTAITSLVFYYRTKNSIDIDYLNGQLLLNTQSMNINLETNSYINLKSTRANPVRIITNNNTHMWEFDSTGSLTLPREGKIYGIGQGAASNRYGYISWAGNSSGDGSGYNTIKLVPDLQDLENADQYIIIDPTGGVPGHIHIRAGGTQDNSGADLYLGGEHSHVKISAGANPPVTVMANDNAWIFGTDGDLTIPGDIKSTANTSIIIDGGVLLADVTVLSVDSFGDGVWRMFISNSAYSTLGTIVQVGDTATIAWNNSVTATITSIVEDIGAGTWALHTNQNLITGWYQNPDARRTTINSTQVKTWTFGTDGTTLFPNQAIDGGTAPIELKSRSWSQLTYNNISMTPAPNKNHSTTFYVEGGDAILEIFRWDGTSALQHRQWTFSNDGSLTLPDTGTITFPDSTTQNTAASITIVGDDSTGVTLNAGETIKIAGAGLVTTAVSGDTLTITGSKDINVNSITSSDSSAIQINDGVNVSGVLNAKTLITNTISSEDSTAIQVNDGLRISGDLTFSDNTVQTTAYVPADNLVKVSGTWTVTTGTNTYSFTVPIDGTYTMWVKGNIPNGIIIWNATVSVSNSNVAAIGTQYAWNYTGGGSPISLTGIPGQIRGSAGTISTDATYAGGTSNRFDFGISNTSGSSQTIYYGYTKIS